MQFQAKPVVNQADEMNVLLFQAAEARTQKDGAPRALAALDRILQAYPTDGNLRFTRAELLREAGRKAEALADAKQVLALGKASQLRTRFTPPTRGRISREQALAWLEDEISHWENERP